MTYVKSWQLAVCVCAWPLDDACMMNENGSFMSPEREENSSRHRRNCAVHVKKFMANGGGGIYAPHKRLRRRT